MEIIMDLHTHTVHSHGKNTVEQNARAAAMAGMRVLGICEHGPRHAFFAVRNVPAMEKEARLASNDAANGGLFVLTGYEFNLLSPKGELDYRKANLRLAGFHRGVAPKTAAQTWFVTRGFLAPKSMRTVMTDAVIAAIETYEIDALTHPGEYVPVDIAQVAAAAARRGTALEINESHSIGRKEVETAAGNNAKFIVSSDAHRADRVGKFPASECLAEQTGVEHLVFNAQGYSPDGSLRLERLLELL